MNVLVLDAHSNAGIATIQSLGINKIKVFAASHITKALGFSSGFVTKHFDISNPINSPKEYVMELEEILESEQIDWVFTPTDNSIYPIRQFLSTKLKRKCLLPPENSFDTVFNKERTLLLAKAIGIPVPDSKYFDKLDNLLDVFLSEVALPVFIKPVVSKSWGNDKGVNLAPIPVNDRNNLFITCEKFLKHCPIQIQQCIQGKGVGVEVLANKGNIVAMFSHERIHEYPLTGGGSSYRKSIEVPEQLAKYSKDLINELQWDGVAMIEFKENDNQYWLIEINGRLWGSLSLALRSGMHFPYWWLMQRTNTPFHVPTQYKLCFERNINQDLNWQIANLKASSNPLLLTKPKLRSIIDILRVLIAKDSWDHCRWSDKRLAIKLIYDAFSSRFNLIINKIHKLIAKQQLNFNYNRLKKRSFSRILVICYGNIYRSALAKAVIDKETHHFDIKSAGFHKKENRNAGEEFITLSNNDGYNLNEHKSKRINKDLINWAQLIIVMDYNNQSLLQKFAPSDSFKAVLLNQYLTGKPTEIQDPYGKSSIETFNIYTKIISSIRSFIKNTTTIKTN